MKKFVIVIFALLMVLSSTSFCVSPIVNALHDPKIHITDSTSTNWSGYAVLTSLQTPQRGAVSDVKGSWTVPAVQGTQANTYSSFWVGIDGYSSGTVEQIGTDSDTNSAGQPVYYAWYEMYPKYPVNLKITINAGDQISAEVQYVGSNKFTLTVIDVSTGATFSTTQKSQNTARSSAEWVAEAPSSRFGVLPLTNFGTVAFSNCQATLNGHTGTISDSTWKNDAITMATSSGTVKAAPSGLSAAGDSFSVTWNHQ